MFLIIVPVINVGISSKKRGKNIATTVAVAMAIFSAGLFRTKTFRVRDVANVET